MGMRMDALWRIVAFLWSFVASFVASIIAIVGFFWGVVDVLWQLVVGSDGLSASSSPAMLVKATLMWPVELMVFAFTGDGDMMWLPAV